MFRVEQLSPKAFNPKNANNYRGYFPLIPGKLSHKHGYDIGQDSSTLSIEQRGNPLVEETPRLILPGREKEVDEFYKVSLHKTF